MPKSIRARRAHHRRSIGADDGLSADDAVTYAKALKADGLDYIDVSSGGITADTRNPTTPGYNVPIAERIKREVGIATRVVGLIVTPAQAEAIVAEGKADMVAMARGMLDDPRWGWHAARGARRRGAARAAISARRPEALGAGRRTRQGLTSKPMRNLAIDAERLWGEIMETAAIGGTAKGGICRLTLTDLDRQVRDWFKARAEKLGCRVTIDDMGAMFARREGTANVPPIAFGSHLDTQPTGGKFDGVLGVLAALEALRTLVEAGYETYAPIEVVNWTNEEGSRFAPAMVASGVFAKRVRERLGAVAAGPRRHDLRRGAGRDRLSRPRAMRRASAVGVLRAAYRAGTDPGGRRQGHRRRHRRAGDALVRGDDHRARTRTPARRRCICARTRCSAPRG